MRSGDIVPGGIFPNYELPDHTGTVRKLSELQGDDPLILTGCAAGHEPSGKNTKQRVENSPRSTRRSRWRTRRSPRSCHGRSPYSAGIPCVSRSRVDISFGPRERTVQKDLDILAEYTDPDNNPMIRHTLVLGPGLVIYSIYKMATGSGTSVRCRSLAPNLRVVTSEIRQDWDLEYSWIPAGMGCG